MESYYLYYTLKDYLMKSDEGKRDEEKGNQRKRKVIRNEIQKIGSSQDWKQKNFHKERAPQKAHQIKDL